MTTRKIRSLCMAFAFIFLCSCSGSLYPVETHIATPKPTVSGFMETGYPIVKEKITLTAFQWELDNQAIDFANLWFYKQLEEKTNVHVDFDEVKETDWTTKQNLMFASGNYCDIVMRGSLDVEEYGVAEKLLVPLDGYLQTYMPEYSSRLQLNDAGASIPSSDGKSYYIGFLYAQEINTNGHWFINTQWLETLGLQMPTTIDELTDVLRAFKERDPNRNGVADEVPYQATFDDNNTGIYNAFASWGIPENEYFVFIDKNDKVRFPALQSGYRECLEWLHMLYEEGLIDQECISQDANIWSAKLNRNTGGYFTYWRLINTALSEDITRQFKCMVPVPAQGYNARVSATLEVPDFGAALTIANRHIPETLRWLDAQMETEMMMVSQNGPVGDTLRYNEAEGKYEVVYVPENNELYKSVPIICGQFFAPADYYGSIYKMAPHRIEKRDYCALYTQSGVMEYKSFNYLTKLSKFTAEQNNRKSKLFIDIEKCMTEAITSFITQGVTDDSWKVFQDRLEQIGANEYVTMYQQIYDDYLAKDQ